jgi:hypothetical protein
MRELAVSYDVEKMTMTKEESAMQYDSSTVDPAIQSMIYDMVNKYSASREGDDLKHFREAKTEGERVDILCYVLGGAQQIELSTKLKALRYVRKFSRQLHGAPLDERPFDFPLMQNHDYWAKVDGHFMEYLELQTRNSGGQFFGDRDFSGLEHCKTDYYKVASLPQADILKSAVVMDGEPLHVFYLARTPSYDLD